MNTDIKAVIFDLDGTLLDTEKLLIKYWCKAANDSGFPMTREQALMLRSLTHKLVPELFHKWFGEDCDYKTLRALRMRLMSEHIERYGLEVKKGAKELLDFLGENGYRRAVATATDVPRASELLKKAGLYDCFDSIISASMVEWGKPYPDIYIYAANRLGLETGQCMAAEDSPNGVVSASDAGCVTVMIPDLTEPDEELKKRCFAVCGDLTGIKELLMNGE